MQFVQGFGFYGHSQQDTPIVLPVSAHLPSSFVLRPPLRTMPLSLPAPVVFGAGDRFSPEAARETPAGLLGFQEAPLPEQARVKGLKAFKGTLADVKAAVELITAIEGEEFGQYYMASLTKREKTAAGLRETCLPSGSCYMIRDGDNIVGTASLGVFLPDKGTKPVFMIESLYIHQNYRGLKLGRWMLESLLVQAKRMGADKIYLYAHNDQAIRLYQQVGFKLAQRQVLFKPPAPEPGEPPSVKIDLRAYEADVADLKFLFYEPSFLEALEPAVEQPWRDWLKDNLARLSHRFERRGKLDY